MNNGSIRRMRRLRGSDAMRDLIARVRLTRDDLVAPLFVRSGRGVRNEIPSMPGQFQFSVDTAVETAKRWHDKGIRAVLLFGIPEHKDESGSAAWDAAAPVQDLIRALKHALPTLLVMTDVCLCEYTAHGQCGPTCTGPDGGVTVDNDATLPLLARTAVSHAECGADVVAPSAMMDGQVGAIRTALDQAGHVQTAILSYAVKYASALYGPFRDAAESTPGQGDRRGYQMDLRASGQARPEADADIAEGADMLMVKPASAYLDVIAEVRGAFDQPLAAYHVSGEYAMLKAAAERGWLKEQDAAMEILTAIKRAGADLIITYYSEQAADWMGA